VSLIRGRDPGLSPLAVVLGNRFLINIVGRDPGAEEFGAELEKFVRGHGLDGEQVRDALGRDIAGRSESHALSLRQDPVATLESEVYRRFYGSAGVCDAT